MKTEVDISGRIDQWDDNTYFALSSIDGNFNYSIMLDKKTKKSIRKKYGHITDFTQKVHCACLYYLLKPHLRKLHSVQFCRDINKPKLLKYLSDYFVKSKRYNSIAKEVKSVGKTSPAHKYLKQVRNKKKKSFRPDSRVNKSDICNLVIPRNK